MPNLNKEHSTDALLTSKPSQKSFDDTPIIVGAAQVTEPTFTQPSEVLSYSDLASQACVAALKQCSPQPINNDVDTIVSVRTFADSMSLGNCPFGMPTNLPRAIAKRANINPKHAVYEAIGGETPQKLVGEFCEKLANKEAQLVLLTGVEVIANVRAAKRQGLPLDWHEDISGELEDRGATGGYPLFNEIEYQHNLIQPMQFYALMEQARRSNLKLTSEEYAESMGELFAHYSEVAARHPHAFFPKAYSAQELITPSSDNPMMMTPYPKRLIAKDGVNQAAALVLTTVGKAKELGIEESLWVYLHGYTHVKEQSFLDRENLAYSPAMKNSLTGALSFAGVSIDKITYMDLYSCFPIVVSNAIDVLGLEPNDSRALTVTGGLPFFGGPGNNYTMHSIVSMVDALRLDPGSFGLIYGNGGWMSKHAAGIYSTQEPEGSWSSCNSSELQKEIDELPHTPLSTKPRGEAIIESYTLSYLRGQLDNGLIIGRLKNSGARFVAIANQKNHSDTLQTLSTLSDPIRATIEVFPDTQGNYFIFK